VVVDSNDLAADILGASDGVDRGQLPELFADNPLGQTDEQTPICVLRRMRVGPRPVPRPSPEVAPASVG
jgi:hypothetical protein